jgi:glycosyltransferase involved in cell wall biosynthesis
MSENPLVSVIIPIYKVEQYLQECVDSVIAQTYTNLEIILVDDGSPDKCPEICDEYAKQDNRIKVIHKTNGGLSDARNAGIEIAKGEYMSFVDSDDVIHNQMIEVLMKPILEDKGLKMSACQFLKFDDGKEFDKNQEIKQVEIIDFREYFTKRIWTTAWGKVYEKSLFETIQYPVGRLHEDEFTTYKICYEAKKVAYTESQLLFYRQREGSIMNAISVKRITDTYDALKERVDFFLAKKEKELYAKYLFHFAGVYYLFYNTDRNHDDVNSVLKQWKKDFSLYSKKNFTLKQKINFFLFKNFPRFKCFLVNVKSKFFII